MIRDCVRRGENLPQTQQAWLQDWVSLSLRGPGHQLWLQEHEQPVGHAAAAGLVTAAVLAAAADDGRESSSVPGTVHVTLASDDLRNLRACKVSF